MNLLDAIKSGKKFRRKGNTFWIDEVDIGYSFNRKEVISEDYEIEQTPREIWCVEYESGRLFFDSEQAALIGARKDNGRVVKFREVLE